MYKLDKERENKAAMEVLPDLLAELDKMGPRERLVSLVEGVLAANIFDWGSKACEELYRRGALRVACVVEGQTRAVGLMTRAMLRFHR